MDLFYILLFYYIIKNKFNQFYYFYINKIIY